MSHWRLAASTPPDRLETEIRAAKILMETRLGSPVDAFCWVGGEEGSNSREAAERVRRAGYRLAFMTNNLPVTRGSNPLQLQRTNVEAGWPLPLVRFALSGVMDVAYWKKRNRVMRLTA